MNCPCCALPLETQKIASVNFDICHSCLGVWLPIQGVSGIVSARGMSATQFMTTLLGRIQKIEHGSYSDKLTGLGNRKFFDRQLSAEIARARGSHFISLVLMDLDGFKAANDEFGHATGDLVLKEFGGLLSHIVRKSDCAARVGGDEFGLILPETDPEGAKAIAARVVKETAEYRFFSIDDRPLTIRIRVSCGIASYPADFGAQPSENAGELCEQILDLADAALYAAKERGRGMAVASAELTDDERAKHVLVREK